MSPGKVIDLTPFCSVDPTRPGLHSPFSVGDWTYATDGCILVRVPRRDDVPEISPAPNVQRPIDTAGPLPALRALGKIRLPRVEKDCCFVCDGRGTAHDCPSCECQCCECAGAGSITETATVSFSGVLFDVKYIRLLLALPNTRFAENPPSNGPAWFVFDGGEGLLMPMSCRAAKHVEAWPAATAEPAP